MRHQPCPYCGRVDGHRWTCREVAGSLTGYLVGGLFMAIIGLILESFGRTGVRLSILAFMFVVIAAWLLIIFVKNRD
jgi:hypothetical protein